MRRRERRMYLGRCYIPLLHRDRYTETHTRGISERGKREGCAKIIQIELSNQKESDKD